MLKKWKLQQVLVYFLAIIVCVNNFQAPAVLRSFLRDGNNIAGGSNRSGGWGGEGGLIIGKKMEYEENWKLKVQFGTLLNFSFAHRTPNWW